MEEVQYQEQPIVEEDGFFDDYSDDEEVSIPTETEESTEQTETPTETKVAEGETKEEVKPSTKPFMQVTYNKETRDLTEEDARLYAQKGMNYDKLVAERDKLNEQYSSINSRLDRLAKLNGTDLNGFLNNLENLQNETLLENEIASLREQYPDASDNILKELAQTRINADTSRNQIANAQKEQKAMEEHRADLKKQAEDFNFVYPNLDIKAMTEDAKYDELWKIIDAKKCTLLEGYTIWSKQQEAKIQANENTKSSIAKLNEENKTKSLGNTNNISSVESDDFMSGWNEE